MAVPAIGLLQIVMCIRFMLMAVHAMPADTSLNLLLQVALLHHVVISVQLLFPTEILALLIRPLTVMCTRLINPVAIYTLEVNLRWLMAQAVTILHQPMFRVPFNHGILPLIT